MASLYRQRIFALIVNSLNGTTASAPHLNVSKLVRLADAKKTFGCAEPQFKLPIPLLGQQACVPHLKSCIQKQVDVEGVTDDRQYLYIKIKNDKFSKHILRTVHQQRKSYGYMEEGDVTTHPQQILVEYSSPNMAKPFHAGHLRSTLLGNFISNLYEALGHEVTRLNFLGDWGTQFGLLLTGYHRYGDSEKLKADPLFHLFEVYVRVNQDVEMEQSQNRRSTYQEALQTFSKLECGDADVLSLWKDFCHISLNEYNAMYQRLGVRFSDVHTESMYRDAARSLIDQLTKEKTLHIDQFGVGSVEVTCAAGKRQNVKLVKSDGSTLYLSRDVAAAVDRFNKYCFNKIHYVVDHSQTAHFQQLQAVLDLLGHTWSHQSDPHFHVAFGQVEGMSTRRGQVVFLRHILDEAKQQMLQTLQRKQTTQASVDLDEVAEVLGISSIIVQDLKERRTNSYTFSWERMLNFKSDSGVSLQYCHARLCSLLESSKVVDVECVDGSCLTDDTACRLIQHIAIYPDVVQQSLQSLEPCLIVQYLFRLSHLVNAAYKRLPIKNQPEKIAQARLSLFDSSRQTIGNGMELLGIKPLKRM